MENELSKELEELKPCPFCGSKAIFKEHPYDVFKRGSPMTYFVVCSNDECIRPRMSFWSNKKAIDAWNLRICKCQKNEK